MADVALPEEPVAALPVSESPEAADATPSEEPLPAPTVSELAEEADAGPPDEPLYAPPVGQPAEVAAAAGFWNGDRPDPTSEPDEVAGLALTDAPPSPAPEAGADGLDPDDPRFDRPPPEPARRPESIRTEPRSVARAAPGSATELGHPAAETGPEEIIRTEALTKIYETDDGEELTALDHLDLTVCKGEIFGLLGPNGAGKTTTVGMLTTRVIPTSGRAVVAGVDVVAEPARAKHGIGVVHQANTLDRSLTVSENLYFHARYFGMTAKAATLATEAALERFRLGARRKSEVRTLSGGMARRLMVARAILHDPAVLFLDEPTAGLDPQSRLALWDIVSELHDDGHTIMLTTHYMEEADRFCNRVAIVDHGRILALDTPANLKQSADLRHDSAKAQLARLRALARVAEPNQLDEILDRPGGEAEVLDPIVAPDTAEELFEGVTLESVFIELTGRDLRE